MRDYGTAKWEGGDQDCNHSPARKNPNSGTTVTGGTGNNGHIHEGYKGYCPKCGAHRIDEQIGLEPTPDEYVAKLVAVFRECRRVLRDDGTLWLNLGDSYAGSGCGTNDYRTEASRSINKSDKMFTKTPPQQKIIGNGYKPKDLIGIPWMVAKALQAPYYTGRINKEIDRVWLAAMIDAEGTICGFTHVRKDDGTTRTGVHIQITNSNMRILEEAARIWPASITEHTKPTEGHIGLMDTFRWIAHDVNDKSLLVAELYPYMVAKKKQALLAWNFFEMSKDAKRLGKSNEAATVKEKRAWIVNALSELNHLRDVDIPNWCTEPPSLYEPGWYLRSDIVWHKPNPMPESVKDRPTKAHEYIFLLAKSQRYYYDHQAIQEPSTSPTETAKRYEYQFFTGPKHESGKYSASGQKHTAGYKNLQADGQQPNTMHLKRLEGEEYLSPVRNKRSVWTVTTKPYREAHFATFPPDLIEPCILAGCPVGGTVLDPFNGSGTTGAVALKHGRDYIGIELNPEYIELTYKRLATVQPTLEVE